MSYLAKSGEHRRHDNENGVAEVAIGYAFDNKDTHASAVKVGDIAVAVAHVGAECCENGCLGVKDRAAVNCKIFQAAVVAA